MANQSNDSDWIDVDDDSNWVDVPSEQKSSAVASGGRGLIQGLTGGFSDELAGIGEAAGKAIGLEGVGSKPALDIGLSAEGPTLDWETLRDAYKKARDHEREILKKDKKDNPGIAYGSEIVGGVASPINKIAKGMSALKGGAALGGVMGLGASDADSIAGNVIDAGTGALAGGVIGGAVDKAMPYISKGLGAGKDLMNQSAKFLEKTPVEGIDDVVAASKRLGVEPIDAMLTSNAARQKVESGLAQSGSIPAMSVRDKYQKFFEGIKKSSDDISNIRSGDTEFAMGGKIRDQIIKDVEASKAPVSKMYQEIVPHLKQIEVNPDVTEEIFNSLKKDDLFSGYKDAQELLDVYKQKVLDKGNLADLKELRTMVGKTLDKSAPDIDALRINKIRNAITSVRDNSINTLKNELPESAHGEINKLIDDIALADAAHSSNIKDLNSIKGLFGNKDINSASQVIGKANDSIEGALASKAGNLDVKSLSNMQQTFPELFDLAKQSKVDSMIEKATTTKDGFDFNSFMKSYDKLDKEVADMIFDQPTLQRIKDLAFVKGAIPERLGKSGTPEGLMTADSWTPTRIFNDTMSRVALAGGDTGSALFTGAADKFGNAARSFQKGGGVFEKSKAVAGMIGSSFQPGQKVEQTIDKINKPKNLINPEDIIRRSAGSKYAGALQKAAEKGDNSLAAAHFVLGERDPEYRKIMNKDENN